MKHNLSIVAAFALGFLFFRAEGAFAIGMVTDPIVVNDILRGQEVSRVVRVLNTEENVDVVYQLKTFGKIQEWTTYYETGDLNNPITKVKVPAGQYYDLVAKFKVPSDIDNGSYEGEIAIYLEADTAPNSEKVQMEIVQGLRKKVTINVSDIVSLDFSSSVLPLKYKISQGEPLEIKVTYNNKGNVLIMPDLAVKITNKETNEIIHDAIYPFPVDKIKYVGIYEKQTLPLIKWPTDNIAPGKYKVELGVLIDKKSYYNNYFDLLITDREIYSASLVSAIGNKPFIFVSVALSLILGIPLIIALLKARKGKAINDGKIM